MLHSFPQTHGGHVHGLNRGSVMVVYTPRVLVQFADRIITDFPNFQTINRPQFVSDILAQFGDRLV